MAAGNKAYEFQHMDTSRTVGKIDPSNIGGSIRNHNTAADGGSAFEEGQIQHLSIGPSESSSRKQAAGARMSILLLVALACSQRNGLSQSLVDLFSGKAKFQTAAEAQTVSLHFKDKNRQVYGQKLAFFESDDDPGMIYAATRGQTLPGLFNIFLMKSKDGVCFTQVSTAKEALGSECTGVTDPNAVVEDRAVFDSFPKIPQAGKEFWTVYDPYITVDTSGTKKKYIMTMECAQLHPVPFWYSTFGASVCTSTSEKPGDPASWTRPQLLVESLGSTKSASTGVLMINNENKRFLKWTVVDDGNFTEPARGTYSNTTLATYSGTTYLPRFSAGRAAEVNKLCKRGRVPKPGLPISRRW